MSSNVTPLSVSPTQADVCLFLEGTYPYVSGGVSTWTHELIREQSHLTFHLVTLLPPSDPNPEPQYDIPSNVVGMDKVVLQDLPQGVKSLPTKQEKDLFIRLEVPLLTMQEQATLLDFEQIVNCLHSTPKQLGEALLLNSEAAWNMLRRMYFSRMGNSCFLDYFWTWRALLGGLYSTLLGPMPDAKVYHSLCTGYAGLYLARAKLETDRPCILTEHGIYTNERRIEIAIADWLEDGRSLNLSPDHITPDLRDFWMGTFTSYSQVCYEACDRIVTLYEGNLKEQIADGADEQHLSVIVNGVDYDKYAALSPEVREVDIDHPVIALIGRVVPIKDVKTFIRVCDELHQTMPSLRAYIMGPQNEDAEYYEECMGMIAHYGLEKCVQFTGRVNISEYLPKIDVQVLTSVSEVQPLVVLEAGAAGIPSVTTDVGACREMIEGRADESPRLGRGGAVCTIGNPQQIAGAIQRLLEDKHHYQRCSKAIQERVRLHYNKQDQHASYKALYDACINGDHMPIEQEAV